jgi:phage baseplate assembly protein gpV
MRKSSTLIGLVVLMLALPLAVFASHQFTDVPDSNTFHNSIDWMKDNGITVGCNPPANTQYCPSDNVTRGQMAAFMKRLAENNVVDAATLDSKDSGAYTNPSVAVLSDSVAMPNGVVVELAELSITAPAAGGLVINGHLDSEVNTIGQATFWLQADNATCTFDTANFYSIDAGRIEITGGFGTSASIVGAAAVAAGPHTVTMCARTFTGGPLTGDTSLVAQFVTSLTKSGSISSAGGGGEGEPTS